MSKYQVLQGHDGNGEERKINVTERINSLAQTHVNKGAAIIINSNWRFSGRKQSFRTVLKLSQTNDRYHGRPKHIIWACYPS